MVNISVFSIAFNILVDQFPCDSYMMIWFHTDLASIASEGSCSFKKFSSDVIRTLKYDYLSTLSLEELRVQSLYQNAKDLYHIDTVLSFLSTQDIVVLFHPPFQTRVHMTLLMKLIDILPNHKRPHVISMSEVTSSRGYKALMHTLKSLGNIERSSHIPFSEETIQESIVDFSTKIQLQSLALRANYARNISEICYHATNCSLDEIDIEILSQIRRNLDKPLKTKATQTTEKMTQIKLLCLTYSTSSRREYVQDIVQTWGSRCDGYLAFSNESNPSISTVHIVPPPPWTQESYHEIWRKIQFMLRIVEDTFMSDYDYFFLAGDDVFLIVENLKKLLESNCIQRRSGDGNNPIYLGRKLHANSYLSFYSGGSGYVLNRAALRLLLNQMRTNPDDCLVNISASMEDLLVAHCLQLAGLEILDIHDLCEFEGPGQFFHPVTPQEAFESNEEWYTRMAHRYSSGLECCHAHSISFHNIHPPRYSMKCIDTFLYSPKDSCELVY